MAYRNTAFSPIVDAENDYLREMVKEFRTILRNPELTNDEKIQELRKAARIDR